TDLPSRAIQKQIASAVDVIVQAQRVRGGARKIVSICEVTGMANGETETQELFQYRQLGVDDDGNAVGFHAALGNLSIHMEHFAERAEFFSPSIFDANAGGGSSGRAGDCAAVRSGSWRLPPGLTCAGTAEPSPARGGR